MMFMGFKKDNVREGTRLEFISINGEVLSSSSQLNCDQAQCESKLKASA